MNALVFDKMIDVVLIKKCPKLRNIDLNPLATRHLNNECAELFDVEFHGDINNCIMKGDAEM